MLKLPFFLRTAKHQKFEYKPMYYNERKEDLRKRVERIEREKAIERGEKVEEHYKQEHLRERIRFQRSSTTIKRTNNYSLMLILVVLSFCCAYFWYIGYKWQALALFAVIYVLFRFVRIRSKLNRR